MKLNFSHCSVYHFNCRLDFEDIAAALVVDPDFIDIEDLFAVMLDEIANREPPTHRSYADFSVDNFNEEEFKTYFRFKKEDLNDLVQSLKLEDNYSAANEIKWDCYEGICILLRRLSYPNRLSDLVPLFGRHKTELSVIVNTMLEDIFVKHKARLDNIFHPWMDVQSFADAVHRKGSPLDNIWAFLDGTQNRICRPRKGQESVFNGHKRFHSLKYQSLMTPNGMIAHFFGPVEGRRHDSAMYFESGLDPQLQQLFANTGMSVYGDSAYAFRPYLVTPFKGAGLNQMQIDFNSSMASVRESVEWGFALIASKFAFVDYHKNIKVYLQPVAKYYIVSALLTNANTCLYGSQVASYFNMQPPTLKEYFY